jgi:hypothetical protein
MSHHARKRRRIPGHRGFHYGDIRLFNLSAGSQAITSLSQGIDQPAECESLRGD